METSKMALLVASFGVAISFSSYWRWFIIYYDPSQMLFGVCIGILIFLFAYIYNWMIQRQKDISKLEKRLDAVVMKLMGLEKDQINNDMRGME